MTISETLAALAPCPFCGGRGLAHRVPTGWRVSCVNCDCQPRPGLPPDTEAGAIAAWNTRTIRPIEELVLKKLSGGPMWANSFRHVKPVIEALVKRGLIIRVAPPGGRAKNMLTIPELSQTKSASGERP